MRASASSARRQYSNGFDATNGPPHHASLDSFLCPATQWGAAMFFRKRNDLRTGLRAGGSVTHGCRKGGAGSGRGNGNEHPVKPALEKTQHHSDARKHQAEKRTDSDPCPCHCLHCCAAHCICGAFPQERHVRADLAAAAWPCRGGNHRRVSRTTDARPGQRPKASPRAALRLRQRQVPTSRVPLRSVSRRTLAIPPLVL